MSDGAGRGARAATDHATVLAAVPDAYLAVDLAGGILTWNDAATEMFGWSRDEVLGRNPGDLLLNPRRAAQHHQQVEDYRTTGTSIVLGRHADVPMATRDGRLLRVDCLVWPATDHDGTTTLHTLMSDVTDRYLAAVDARRATEDLGAFSAAMAHDLRVPLTLVKGYAELVGDALGTAADTRDSLDWVRRIDAAAERGVGLIDDILRYLGVGRVLVTREPVDLTALVERVAAEQLRASLREATIDVRPLPMVLGDDRLLAQLFGNLLGNALKYVPAHRPVDVVVDTVPSPWGGVVVRVADNGDTVPEHDRTRIFSMFERGSGGTAGTAGSGVGLAVSQRIAELHDGEIEVEPSPAGGSRFCVRLGS